MNANWRKEYTYDCPINDTNCPFYDENIHKCALLRDEGINPESECEKYQKINE